MAMRDGVGSGERPVMVLMHFLGGSAREWDEVVEALGPEYPTMRVELAGFGDAAGETGYSVAEMADAVERKLREQQDFVLVGHSMSGKVSAVIARRMEDAGDGRLKGLVLVAPSPPGPEPMAEEKRGASLGLLGTVDPAKGREGDLTAARQYVAQNQGGGLAREVAERTAHEVLRMNRTAWVAWLTEGSKEDWGERVGLLETPALVLAGEKDGSLGPEVQRKVTLPHLKNGRVVTVEGANHLIPVERPVEVANALKEFLAGLEVREQFGDGVPNAHKTTEQPGVPAEYVRFIEGERLSEPTRAALEKRMDGPGASEGVLTEEQEEALRAMVARVIPQEGEEVNVAGTILARLKKGKGDGWRYAVLPEDVEAYRMGLNTLLEEGFTAMTEEEQDWVLGGLAEQGPAMQRWFEDVRADAVEAWISHPATMARVGYSGPGVGGAGTKFKGYVSIGVDDREAWEPRAEGPESGERGSKGD